ncbi:MAG: cellulose biosynthesis cyclic di-GMP-binding regulatory protein BcsB [Phototrophicaceae bacterium]
MERIIESKRMTIGLVVLMGLMAILLMSVTTFAQDSTPEVTTEPDVASTLEVSNDCYEYAVTVSSANIRENPSVESAIITGVQEDALICVLGVVPYLEREWFIVDVNRGEGEQQIGFMAQNTVSAVGEVLPSPTPSPVGGLTTDANSAELVTTPSVCNGADCVEAVAVAAGDLQAVDLTFTQLTRSDLELISPQSSVNFRFVLPSDWSIQDGNRINLVFDYVELGNALDIARAPSSQLDVRLDNQLLSSYILDRDNQGIQNIEVALPADVLADEADRSHNLELVLTALDHCDANLSSRLTVDKDASFMHLEYVELEPVLDLSVYPRPFFEVHPNDEVVYVVLPDEATASELTSAGRVVAGLGSTAGRLDVRTRTVSSLSAAEYSSNNLILVGFPETHDIIETLYANAQLPTSWTTITGFLDQANEAIAESDGILQVMQHPDDARFAILVVTGASDAAILKAGQALGGSPTAIGLQGAVTIVEDATPRVNAQSNNLLSTGLTLENLGFTEDVVLSGLGEQSIFIEFFVPYGVTVNEEAYIELLYNNSSVLEDRGATVTVEVNSIPVASTILRGRAEDTNEVFSTRQLRASIPPTAIQTGALNGITVTLSGFDIDRCEVTNLNALWLTISRESQIFLPIALQERQQPLVAQFPSPYNGVATLSDVLISIPDEPTSAELEQVMDLMFYLGNTGSGASGMNPQMVRGVPSDDLDLSAYHIITLGRPSNNSFFTVIGDDLPQPITADDTLEQVYNNLIYRLDGSYETGVLQVLASPFNPDRDLLVITGTDDATQALTIEKLLSNFDSFEMAGDVVFVSQQTTYPLNSLLAEQEFGSLQSLPALATESALLLQQTSQPVTQVADGTSAPAPTATVLATDIVATNEVAVESTAIQVIAPLATATPVIEPIAAQELTPETLPRPVWVQYLVIGTAIATLIALISRVALSFRKKDNQQ